MDYAPIILLLAGGTLAWLSTRTASTAIAGEGPVNIEKLGGDVEFPKESDTIAALQDLMTDTLMRGGEIQFNSPEFQLALSTPIRGTTIEESSGGATTIPEATTVDLLPEGEYRLVMQNSKGYLYYVAGVDCSPVWGLGPPYGMIWEENVQTGYQPTDYLNYFTSTMPIHPDGVVPGGKFTIRRT